MSRVDAIGQPSTFPGSFQAGQAAPVLMSRRRRFIGRYLPERCLLRHVTKGSNRIRCITRHRRTHSRCAGRV